MAIKVDDSLIKKLEKLSRIALSKDEEESLKNDLNTILEYMSILDEADVSGVREMYSPASDELTTVLHDDLPEKFDGAQSIVAQFPKKKGDLLVVPSIQN